MARFDRNQSVDPTEIQVLHLWNRCVRRSFLCGYDPLTGIDYEYRREWSRQRLIHLASVFAIEVLTYAIMSNHTHQVLRSRPDLARAWDAETVARRWLSLTPRGYHVDGSAKAPSEKQFKRLLNQPQRIEQLRRRLSDVSWWMKYFAQHIAVRANREDQVTGHFWEARFKSEVLVEDSSILRCMLYVDLNPIRAKLASTPEESDYTGAKDRIDDWRIHVAVASGDGVLNSADQIRLSLDESTAVDRWERLDHEHSGWLSPIEVDQRMDPLGPDPDPLGRRASRKGILNLSPLDYFELLDVVGRELRADKRGCISARFGPILERLKISAGEFCESVILFGARYRRQPMLSLDSKASTIANAGVG